MHNDDRPRNNCDRSISVCERGGRAEGARETREASSVRRWYFSILYLVLGRLGILDYVSLYTLLWYFGIFGYLRIENIENGVNVYNVSFGFMVY